MASKEPVQPGDKPSAEQAEEIRLGLLKADFSVSPPLEKFTSPTGTHLRLNTRTPIWAKVTGSSSPYSFAEGKRIGDSWNNCCITGTSNAYEVNHVTGLGNTYQYLYPGSNNDWRFQAVQKGSVSCNTSIFVDLYNWDGSKNFCLFPGTLFWTLSGTSSGGTSVSLSGSGNPTLPGSKYTVSFNGTVLPQGSYTFTFVEKAALCGASSPQDNSRFSPVSLSFSNHCPGTNSYALKTTASFDYMSATREFPVLGCGRRAGFDPSTTTTASVSGATLCSSTPYNNDPTITGLSIGVKFSSYPWTIQWQGSGQNVLPADELWTYTSGCGHTSNWTRDPYCLYKYRQISALGCTAYTGAPYAHFEIAGGVTGSGDCDYSGTGWAELTSFVQEKTGTTYPNSFYSNWTISAPRFASSSFTDNDGHGGFQGNPCVFSGQIQEGAPDYFCGGCPTPLPANLHCTVLGKQITLFCSERNPSTGSATWIGSDTYDMLSAGCPDIYGVYQKSVGPVAFKVVFSGILTTGTLANAGTVLYFFELPGDTNTPTTCAQGKFVAANNDSNGYDGGSGGGNSQGCDPFYAHTYATAVFSFNDNTTTRVPYTIDITE